VQAPIPNKICPSTTPTIPRRPPIDCSLVLSVNSNCLLANAATPAECTAKQANSNHIHQVAAHTDQTLPANANNRPTQSLAYSVSQLKNILASADMICGCPADMICGCPPRYTLHCTTLTLALICDILKWKWRKPITSAPVFLHFFVFELGPVHDSRMGRQDLLQTTLEGPHSNSIL